MCIRDSFWDGVPPPSLPSFGSCAKQQCLCFLSSVSGSTSSTAFALCHYPVSYTHLRQALEKAAAEKGVPVVSAGIAGLTGWCKAIFPGETGPASLLAGEGDRPTPDEILGNLAPTVFLAASLQACLLYTYRCV